MKKILILAYDFPPYVSVGGLRPYCWYKYLHEFDIYPIVVTRQWRNKHKNHLDYIDSGESAEIIIEESTEGMIIKTPYHPNFANRLMLKYGDSKFKLLRKVISAFYEFAQFIFHVGPKSSLYFAANNYLQKNKVDAIVATGDPFVLFKYAAELSKKHRIPWIADYRDPWSQKLSIHKNLLYKIWHPFIEKKVVKNASAISTVSEFFGMKISSLLEKKKISIIPNGYDPIVMDHIKEIKQRSDNLNIAFVGSIYEWHPLEIFLVVVSDFIVRNNAKVILNFYGINIVDKLNDLIEIKFPQIKEHVKIFPKMPNIDVMRELSRNNLLLLFNYYSFMGTKIYDYLALNRQIILCFANDPQAKILKKKFYDIEELDGVSNCLQEELINETNSGYVVQDTKHLYEILSVLYAEFCANGYLKGNTKNAEKYSRKQQTKKLSEIINKITLPN